MKFSKPPPAPREDPQRPWPEPGKVDFVYTWIDGAHPTYQEQLRQFASQPAHLNPERFRDSLSLLRYSMRSIQRYVHWAGHIHILTNKPQCPDWLDTQREDVHLHYVEDVMESRLQPCFNSNAIETYLHQIDTQSDYMVFMCDDYLFGSRTELCDFITPDGRLKVFGTWLGEYFPWRIRADRWVRLSWLLGLGDLEHTPHFIYKPWYREMYESRPRDLAMTRRNRFRTPGELKRIYLNNVFLLSHKRSEVDVVPGKELLAYHRLHMIKGPLEKEVAAFQKLRALSLKFYCLNDDMGPNPDPKVVAMILAYLNDMYPTPSRWEKS